MKFSDRFARVRGTGKMILRDGAACQGGPFAFLVRRSAQCPPQSNSERLQNAVRDYFGSFCAGSDISSPVFSHFVIATQATAIEKALILQGFFGRSERI
jgi:hypothetical protein